MTTQKIKSGRMPGVDADSFVAPIGTLFFNEDQGDLRLGDGVTAGGIPLAVGGGGGGGNYVLPTASTTVKGGVKIDGSTITIANQIISVGTVPYSNLSGAPTIPTNTNQLTNGAGFITSSALSGYATETFVTTRGYLTSVSWNDVSGKPTFATVATSGSYADLINKPTIPTNTNQLTNGAGFITSSALTGYATETFVTTRGYLTSVDWSIITSKPSFATVATSGSYTDLTNKPTLFSGSYTDLTNKPTIPSDISQLTDTQGLLGQGGTGGGTTYITNNIENPYTFSVAGDDSTLREISNGETLRFAGATGITVTTDAEGKVTITGPDLSSYATQTYVTNQGYITSSALAGYATETYVTTRGYLTSVDWSIITSKPSFATVATSGSYADLTNKPILFSGSYTDLTNKPVLFSGSYNDLTDKPTIPTDTNQLTNGAGYITSSALTGYATETFVTNQGYITSSALTGYATETFVTNQGYITNSALVGYALLTDIPSIGNITFTSTTIDSTDSSGITFTPAVSFSSDVIVENDLIVVNEIRNNLGEIYATENFVEQAVNDLIAAAPEALNTLKELADALGNDNNFATTILNALNNRVRFDTDSQGLTEQQKANARTNIGAASTTQLNAAVIDLQAEMYAAAVAMG